MQMKINHYLYSALIVIVVVVLAYAINFFGQSISQKPDAWGQLGDYIGGILNPSLSFISIVLLIKSLSLQYDANVELLKQARSNEKLEHLRSFESIYYNMLKAQQLSFDKFQIQVRGVAGVQTFLSSDAVNYLEDKIENRRSLLGEGADKLIVGDLEQADSNDQIFRVLRGFYNVIMLVTERLSNEKGFDVEDRVTHIRGLISFSDFAMLRLVMIGMQFMDYQSVSYLRNSEEFNRVLSEVGLNYTEY